MGLGLGIVLVSAALWPTVPEREANGLPHLRSESVLVRFADKDEIVLERLPKKVRPIASVTKLMSGLLLTEIPAKQRPSGFITIGQHDKDRLKWSRSRFKVGRSYRWWDLVHAAVLASDNRAMYAAVRAVGARRKFVERMNARAAELGMKHTKFADPAGVDPRNVSSGHDLLRLIEAVSTSTTLTAWTQTSRLEITDGTGRVLRMTNPNRVSRSRAWTMVLGKTGYTVEAGRTLVLRAEIEGRTVDMVFLGSREMMSVFGDAGRVRRWLTERLKRSEARAAKPASAPSGKFDPSPAK